MNDATFLSVNAAVATPLLYVSARAARCNLRRYRAARATAPFDGVDVSGAEVDVYHPPRRWPTVDSLTDPGVTAAYASLADDRALSYQLAGEAMAVIGGAWLGVSIPALSDLLTRGWQVLPPLLLSLVGLLIRQLVPPRWREISEAYVERHAVLTKEPAPATPARRRGLFGWLR